MIYTCIAFSGLLAITNILYQLVKGSAAGNGGKGKQMTVNTIETVKAVIEEIEADGYKVDSAWEYTNAMNQQTMFAVFPLGQPCDIYQSPCVQNPKLIWQNGHFVGKYTYLN